MLSDRFHVNILYMSGDTALAKYFQGTDTFEDVERELCIAINISENKCRLLFNGRELHADNVPLASFTEVHNVQSINLYVIIIPESVLHLQTKYTSRDFFEKYAYFEIDGENLLGRSRETESFATWDDISSSHDKEFIHSLFRACGAAVKRYFTTGHCEDGEFILISNPGKDLVKSFFEAMKLDHEFPDDISCISEVEYPTFIMSTEEINWDEYKEIGFPSVPPGDRLIENEEDYEEVMIKMNECIELLKRELQDCFRLHINNECWSIFYYPLFYGGFTREGNILGIFANGFLG